MTTMTTPQVQDLFTRQTQHPRTPSVDPPPYNTHRELGIPCNQYPVISNLLKVTQERNRHVDHHPLWGDVHTTICKEQCSSPAESNTISIYSNKTNDTDSTKNSIQPTSPESIDNLTHCWTCDTSSHLGRPCSFFRHDPDFKPYKQNILYPHNNKRHLQDMLKEMKEQMKNELETKLDDRLTLHARKESQ